MSFVKVNLVLKTDRPTGLDLEVTCRRLKKSTYISEKTVCIPFLKTNKDIDTLPGPLSTVLKQCFNGLLFKLRKSELL